MWLLLVMGLILASALGCSVWWLRRGRRRVVDDPWLRDALDGWQHLPGQERTSRLQAAVKTDPDGGALWYLLGLSLLVEGRCEEGIRALQVSYHREPAFETAALLIFAFQKLRNADTGRLLECLVEAWDESGRPMPGRHRLERAVLERIGGDCTVPARASPLATALWRLPLSELRRQLGSVLSSPATPAWARVLRTEP